MRNRTKPIRPKWGGKREGAGRPTNLSLAVPKDLAAELRAEPDIKKRWERLRNAQDARLRFQVERYIWDRAEGKPVTAKA